MEAFGETSATANVNGALTRRVPRGTPAKPSSAVPASSTSVRMRSACGRNRMPASVSRRWRVERSTRMAPILASRRVSDRLMLDLGSESVQAAAEMLESSAMRAKARRSINSNVVPGVQRPVADC